MGITGLIPFLEKSSKRGNISQFSGGTVAIDTYCWLHKGVFSCADKIAMGQQTDAYVNYCMKFVNMLLANKIKPILVFDGCHLPAKAETEVKRRESREANKKRAAELMKMGKTSEGRNLLRRSIDITHEMALEVIKKCHEKNVDCIVAPYEADAQLAYLNITGIADVVITEDSDLTLFGCKKIFFKMDLTGNGLLVEQDRLHLAMNVRAEHFDIERFRHMCILSGCDYLPSLPGIGLVKACKFITKNSEPNIHKALPRLGSYLNMKSIVVTEEYRNAFIRALITFKHQLVFCPIKRKQVRLHTPTPDVTIEQLYYAGKEKPAELAWNLALGNCDPNSLKQLHNYDPDTYLCKPQKTNSWSKEQPAQHKSIWSKEFSVATKVTSKPTAETSWPNTHGKVEILNTKSIVEKISPTKRSYQDVDNDLTDNDVMRLYGSNKVQKIEKTIEEQHVESEKDFTPPSTPVKNKSNPFLKKNSPKMSPDLTRRRTRRPRTLIAFQPTVIDESTVLRSKYFENSGETDSEKKVIIIPETQDEDLPPTQIDEFKENDHQVNIPSKYDDEKLNRTDSGVDMKDDFTDDKVNNSNNLSNSVDNDGYLPDNSEELCVGRNSNSNELNYLLDTKCDISLSQKLPSSEDLMDYTVNDASVSSQTSSFFKWSNPKATQQLNHARNGSILQKKTVEISSKRRTIKRTSSNKKITLDSQQSLLNMYGFQKNTVSRRN